MEHCTANPPSGSAESEGVPNAAVRRFSRPYARLWVPGVFGRGRRPRAYSSNVLAASVTCCIAKFSQHLCLLILKIASPGRPAYGCSVTGEHFREGTAATTASAPVLLVSASHTSYLGSCHSCLSSSGSFIMAYPFSVKKRGCFRVCVGRT